jgi:tetratricopeptide (TPR) repeat protein
MRALAADGRRVDALAAYRQLRSRMDEQLGLDPNPELRALHDAILRADDEPPAAVTAAAVHIGSGPEPVRPSLLPAPPPYFTGRSGALGLLDRALAGADGSAAGPVCVIAGMAGVGKSSLAVHWAHAVAEQFPDGQLFVNLRGYDATGARIEPAQAIRSFLDALTPPPHRVPASPEARADLYRSLLAGRRALIVLDNAADAEHVRPLLPGSPGCLTVVTSRTQLASLVAIEGARPVQLDLLPEDEARALLARRIGAERTAAEPAAVADILARCAGLPLALAVVSARAALEVDTPLAELAEQLRDARAALDPLPGGDLATDLRAVFSHSYRRLSPPTARLFRLLGLHAGPDIGIAAAASLAGTDRAEAGRLLAELSDAHLVVARADQRYAFHDLLAAYAAELCAAIDPPAARAAAADRLYDHYLHTAHRAATLLYPHRDVIELPPARPETTPEPLADAAAGLAWLHTEYRVLTAAVHHTAAIGLHGYTWRLTWALETYAHRHARWHELVALLHEAVTATRKLGDLAGQAYTHRSLARVYVWLDRFEEGREHFGYALERYIELGDPVAQGRVHHGLTELYDRLDDHVLALHHAERALTLYRSANDRAGEARALNAAGWCHGKLGAHERAVASCEQALMLFEEIGDRVGAAETWDSLGLSLHHLGRYAEAADCFRRSIRMCREMGDVYHVADVLIRLGDTYTATGDPEAARSAWSEALEVLLDLGHPDSATVRAKLATIG